MALKIAVVVGSLRQGSFNKQLAHALVSLAPGDFSFEFLDIGSLPLYSQDYDSDFPEAARTFKQKIAEANGLLIVTPEYNRSIPGVLKNALDWGSRPWGQSAWGGKPGAIIGTSVGAIGTAIAQSHLRGVCAYLDIVLMNQPEMYIKHDEKRIDENGNIVSEDTRKYLQTFMDKYVAWVRDGAA
ncbi:MULTISPECIES: NADPH-dependent FMN reductase [Caballeronia]|uniref:NADPH-dependent FMN reductase n=1 Tax=Caballeronia zhejiangensis TaxID=871203 RepID=A0A656QJP0_9BURK|nr:MULTISPECIES: NADPH-dependent FMN reductase [Caballeronia]KDR29425.1 NADPH-dependent FMN reductase [Caballeronia zhejiangensis]MDR5789371.1 NAD(P)H-dependent oxidoreductase [Caballeronia sp. LP003]